MKNIELGILPLVNAINETRLFTTFSSCEGHFGYKNINDYTDKEKANVGFDAKDGISESQIEEFFAKVLMDHINSPTKWQATLSIYKSYIPDCDGSLPLEYCYVFEIRPFNPHESNADKRKHVNQLIQEVTESVKRYSPRI